MSIKGLPTLVEQNQLASDTHKVVGGQTMTLHLVREPESA
jgi:hypothetical protein